MKHKSNNNGSNNDDWETPKYIYDFLNRGIFANKSYFDPCPLRSEKNGLEIDWQKNNYINPPYNRKDKEAFILKALEESKKGKLCVLLIPASTETKIFHETIIPNASVYLLKKRVKFKGTNAKGIYVTNKCGQTGSMFVIFGLNEKPKIETLDLKDLGIKN